MSTTPSYLIRSKTMLRVMKTPVRPTPALSERKHRVHWEAREWCCTHADELVLSPKMSLVGLWQVHSLCPSSLSAAYLQWTEIGPSWPNCSFVLCTWPMKSMKPSPDFGTPCSGQSVNWNCLTVRDCPSWDTEGWKWDLDRANQTAQNHRSFSAASCCSFYEDHSDPPLYDFPSGRWCT